METIADRLGAVNTEKKQLKAALRATGTPIDQVAFVDFPAFIDLLV